MNTAGGGISGVLSTGLSFSGALGVAGAGRSACGPSLGALVMTGGGRSVGDAGSFCASAATRGGASEALSLVVDSGAFSARDSSINGRARTAGRVPLSPLGRAGARDERGGALGRDASARVALGGGVSESAALGGGVSERDFWLDAWTGLLGIDAGRELGRLEVSGRELGAVEFEPLGVDDFALVALGLGVHAGLEGFTGFELGELATFLALVTSLGDAVVAADFAAMVGAAAIGAAGASSAQSESIASVAGGMDFDAAVTSGSPSQPESMSSSDGSAVPGVEFGERTEDATPMSSKVTGARTSESANIEWGGKHLHARALPGGSWWLCTPAVLADFRDVSAVNASARVT
ncbi:MAG TPA: hypothetical protein VG937_35355 [Polyangiaceae bacterium]|nr:hypothetical protein [Polyangiaceae bacterium]